MYFIDLVAILSGFKTSFRTFFVFKTKKHFLSLQVLYFCVGKHVCSILKNKNILVKNVFTSFLFFFKPYTCVLTGRA